ncbi:hypothetical protein B5M10_09765, partial [Pluralibacter gergoviae]
MAQLVSAVVDGHRTARLRPAAHGRGIVVQAAAYGHLGARPIVGHHHVGDDRNDSIYGEARQDHRFTGITGRVGGHGGEIVVGAVFQPREDNAPAAVLARHGMAQLVSAVVDGHRAAR